MRYYRETEIWRRAVAFREEVGRICGEYDWYDWMIEEWVRSSNVICVSVRMAFEILDEESVLDALYMARGKMFRLSSIVDTCCKFDGLSVMKGKWVLEELEEMVGMVDCLIGEVKDGFWFEGD